MIVIKVAAPDFVSNLTVYHSNVNSVQLYPLIWESAPNMLFNSLSWLQTAVQRLY